MASKEELIQAYKAYLAGINETLTDVSGNVKELAATLDENIHKTLKTYHANLKHTMNKATKGTLLNLPSTEKVDGLAQKIDKEIIGMLENFYKHNHSLKSELKSGLKDLKLAIQEAKRAVDKDAEQTTTVSTTTPKIK
jgi:hypothetical protein